MAADAERSWDEPFNWRGEENTCFGCGPSNPSGLGLEFWRVGERAVECRHTASEELNGAPQIVHGGIQAVMLDESMGYACHTVHDDWHFVTAELTLRYRRPVPTGRPLVVRAEIVQVTGRDIHLEGAIRIAGDDEVLTGATARWVSLGPHD